jgi:hypothetical protein
MAAQNFTEFNLPKNAYAAFDAVSLKNLIIDRLKTSNVFTDQAYEGSNLSAIIDIIAYAYHVSLFYLNNQASEAYFDQASLYENMNKLVSLIGYNPLGSQTSIAPFKATAQNGLAIGTYMIPRYSFIATNGVFYSVTQDIYFDKTTDGTEMIESIGIQNLLYQGQMREYPIQTAIGEEFEVVTLTVSSQVNTNEPFVDNNNIFVFIKDVNASVWSEWKPVNLLYNESASTKCFEKRLNDQGLFELKFGDDITGKKLNAGDVVAIYYLLSNGAAGVISAGTITDANFVRFVTPQYREIISNIYASDDPVATQTQLNSLFIENTNRSTDIKPLENVDDIRANAPKVFAAQNRAVTEADFNAFVTRNFTSIIRDSRALNNTTYINEYIKYFYDIGLKQPNDDSRVLLNQVAFADACDFNNVYIFVVPRNFLVGESQPQVLPTALKQLIVNELQLIKMQNAEVVPSDPVYVAVDIGVAVTGEVPTESIRNNSFLVIKRQANSKISSNQIKTSVYNAVINYFSIDAMKLGQQLNFFDLTRDILAIAGVSSVSTIRNADGVVTSTPGLSFVLWNPQYAQEDIIVTSQNIALPLFKYPFLIDKTALINKIVIE